jgi:putative transposase
MKTRFSAEQSIQILREAETHGRNVEVCRKDGFSEPTFSHWRRKYQGLRGPELQRLKRRESENAQRTRVVAEPAWAIQGVQELLTTTGLP